MSVRFKFRSSVAFDSVDLGGRPSISVREIRSKIAGQKNIQICRDFDLVISDAATGQAFYDEEFQIPQNSSVIIKRVPAGLTLTSDLPASAVQSLAYKPAGLVDNLTPLPSQNLDVENFDDFGFDLYSALGSPLPESDDYIDEANFKFDVKDKNVPRCLEICIPKCPNLEGSDLSEAMPKGIRRNRGRECDTKKNNNQAELILEKEVQNHLDKVVGTSSPTMLNADLPMELRCSLCNSIFKEAVMIPCCQHSFCDKCIHRVLIEKARCPKCSSLRCTVKDLLPNLSLRQAIEHFLEKQGIGTDNQFVPDGESGIQSKELSCAVSVRQLEPSSLHSPSASGKGSDQVRTEFAYQSKNNARVDSHLIHLTADKSVKSSPFLKIKVLKGNEKKSGDLNQMDDSEACGSSSKLSQNLLQKEDATVTILKKKGPGGNPPDGNGLLLPTFTHRKGGRNCYMCGSPNHLIRDCPSASNSYPVHQTGDAAFPGGMTPYGQPYWYGATFPQARPYTSMYGISGMMHFDPNFVPVSPYGVQSYAQSLYGGMPVPYGLMRMGGIQSFPMSEQRFTRPEFMDVQDGARKHQIFNEHADRDIDYDNTSGDYHFNGTRKISHEPNHIADKEMARSFSDDDSQRIHMKRPHGKHDSPTHHRPYFTSDEEALSVDRKLENRTRPSASGKQQRTHHSEKSNSGISHSSDRHSRERRKYHNNDHYKKHNERRGPSHHQRTKEKHGGIVKIEHKRESSKLHNHSWSGLEPDSSNARKHHGKEKQPSESSGHSRQKVNPTDDRWQMIDDLDENSRGEYHHYKRKRTH